MKTRPPRADEARAIIQKAEYGKTTAAVKALFAMGVLMADVMRKGEWGRNIPLLGMALARDVTEGGLHRDSSWFNLAYQTFKLFTRNERDIMLAKHVRTRDIRALLAMTDRSQWIDDIDAGRIRPPYDISGIRNGRRKKPTGRVANGYHPDTSLNPFIVSFDFSPSVLVDKARFCDFMAGVRSNVDEETWGEGVRAAESRAK